MTVETQRIDSELLREHLKACSSDAFSELVARHADWVYSAAVRIVRDEQLAEDISQAAFLLLWQRARGIRPDALNGWLFNVVRHCASNAIRATTRRKKHERLAGMLKSEVADEEANLLWGQLSPVLDQTISRLRRKDRQVLLLRFYRQKTSEEISTELGISSDAARKRVATALRNLRPLLQSAGVTAPAGVLEPTLLSNITHTAPMAVSNWTPTAASPAAVSIAKGTQIMLWITRIKIAAAVAGILLIPLGAGVYLRAESPIAPLPSSPSSTPAPSIPPKIATASDAGLVPFLNSNIGMVTAINLDGLDANAVRERLAGVKFRPGAAIEASQQFRDQVVSGIQLLQQAHASRFYAMLVFKELSQRRPVVIIPLHPGVDADAITHLLATRTMQPGIINNALVIAVDTGEIRRVAAEPRPDLVTALAAGSAPIRVLYVPSLFRNQRVPDDLGNFGVSARLYDEKQWTDVKWCLLEISPLTDEQSTLTYQCTDHDAATSLAELLPKKGDLADADSRPGSPLSFFHLLHGKHPEVNGDRVVIKLDPQDVDDAVLVPLFSGNG